MPPQTVTMRDPDGRTFDVPAEEVQSRINRRWVVEEGGERVERVASDAREAVYSTPAAKITTGILGAGRLVTGGASDVLADAWGLSEDVAALREYNPGVSVAGEVIGAATGIGVAGLATRAGRAVGSVGEGAGVLSRVGGAVKGAAVEGGIMGAGAGVSELALSKDPISLERAISTIGSSALFGSAVGGAVGGIASGAGAALRRGKQSLDNIAARGTAEVDDVAKATFADDVKTFRQKTIDDDLFVTTKGAADRETKTIAKTWLEADKAVDRVLRNPKALKQKPERVLTALQQQEHALEQVLAKADDLKAKFATDTSGARLASLQKIPTALEANRALQARIVELTAKPAQAAAGGFGANMLGGQAFGLAAGVVGAIPGIGPLLAPLAGAAASKLVTEGIGKAMTKQAARMSNAIGSFLNVAEKVGPRAQTLATKTLSSVSYGATGKKDRAAPKAELARTYRTRIAEIKEQTQYDPTGRAVMRPEARIRVAENLAAIRAADPIAADRMETQAARRIEALANRIPRKPDVMASNVGGPDRWQPSDMEMRGFARFAAAIEDPAGVVERLAAGTITPEDRDAMREVYPEVYAQIQMEILSKLPTLRATLPYQRRLAMSIFSGVPVDPAMSPSVMQALQGAYAEEGNAPPMPQPQFGSVKNQDATPSQQRQMT